MIGRSRIILGDSLRVLRSLPSESVQTVVTSPPYFGLRDYGTAKWEGGDSKCGHTMQRSTTRSTLGLAKGAGSHAAAMRRELECPTPYREKCGKCGAVRVDAQLGLEPTPAVFVAALADVFDEVRRVLRPGGTLWLNLGDSYATGAGKVGAHPGGGKQGERFRGVNGPSAKDAKGLVRSFSQPNRMPLPGLKPKDLIGIPWRVAFALQERGWWLRSDIIWHKPNPMPESVRDRPTKSHEYLFLLSKRERYFYDTDAIKEGTTCDKGNRKAFRGGGPYTGGSSFFNSTPKPNVVGGNDGIARDARNKRTVWSIATRSYKGAHFATFPPKLIEPCILAGSRPGDVVLDPFSGAATTGVVALTHGRRYIGIELNPEYVRMSIERLEPLNRGKVVAA